MNTFEKFEAIRALDPQVCLRSRGESSAAGPGGRWYVCSIIEGCKDGLLCGFGASGGSTPEEAIEAWWLSKDRYRYLKCRGAYYEWAGFMWSAVNPQEVLRA